MYCLSLCIVVHDAWTEVAWFQQLQDQSRDIFSWNLKSLFDVENRSLPFLVVKVLVKNYKFGRFK